MSGRRDGIGQGLEAEEGVPPVGEPAARQGDWGAEEEVGVAARDCLAGQGFESQALANPSSTCELWSEPFI